MDKYPTGPGTERPYLNIIDTLRDAKRDTEALAWVERTRNRFRGQPGAALAVFAAAKIYASNNEWNQVIETLGQLKKEADSGGTRVPGGTTPVEVAFLRAFSLEQLGDLDRAIDEYLAIPDGRNEYYGQRATARLRSLNASEPARTKIQGRIERFRQAAVKATDARQFEPARSSAQSALRLSTDGATSNELISILRRAYEELPQYRVVQPKLKAPERQQPRTQRGDGGARSDHRGIADSLLFLGLYDEGTPEYYSSVMSARMSASQDQAVNSSPASTTSVSKRTNAVTLSADDAFTLAVYFQRGDLADQAIRYAEPLWKKVPQDYLMELAPRDMATLLYPSPYRTRLIETATPRGVDPRFVLSIARQESRFRPDAKSGAAARGLLQFIPSTADEIAAQMGIASFDQDQLYRPGVAILFGSQYLGNLFKLFPNMPQAVAASYNGGEDNMARWIARAKSNDPDRYVSETGFGQSKDYIFKVLANFEQYSLLYDKGLEAR
jgi:soluble lytic murein transglycosylase